LTRLKWATSHLDKVKAYIRRSPSFEEDGLEICVTELDADYKLNKPAVMQCLRRFRCCIYNASVIPVVGHYTYGNHTTDVAIMLNEHLSDMPADGGINLHVLCRSKHVDLAIVHKWHVTTKKTQCVIYDASK